jgi:hypothetical protein
MITQDHFLFFKKLIKFGHHVLLIKFDMGGAAGALRLLL